jgi:hypothetical protein
MKTLTKKSQRGRFLFLAIASLCGMSGVANAATFDSVSHIHHIKVVEKRVLVLTHEGLYELVGKNNMKLISKEKTDVMGMASLGKALLASGHPAQGSKMPNPIGLIRSTDNGLSWKAVSLVGKVDFHSLEGGGTDLYGTDSQSGKLLYSNDSGETWKSLGTKPFQDIAVSRDISGTAIALKDSQLFLTKNSFETSTKIKSALKFTQLEWRKSGLYALSGKALYKSTNLGKTWTKQSTLKGAPGILSASDQLMMVTVGNEIYTSTNSGKNFKGIA